MEATGDQEQAPTTDTWYVDNTPPDTTLQFLLSSSRYSRNSSASFVVTCVGEYLPANCSMCWYTVTALNGTSNVTCTSPGQLSAGYSDDTRVVSVPAPCESCGA